MDASVNEIGFATHDRHRPAARSRHHAGGWQGMTVFRHCSIEALQHRVIAASRQRAIESSKDRSPKTSTQRRFKVLKIHGIELSGIQATKPSSHRIIKSLIDQDINVDHD
ncbi:MAG: hypothetical protein ACRYGK_13390 [Janthinobacterium lividum]